MGAHSGRGGGRCANSCARWRRGAARTRGAWRAAGLAAPRGVVRWVGGIAGPPRLSDVPYSTCPRAVLVFAPTPSPPPGPAPPPDQPPGRAGQGGAGLVPTLSPHYLTRSWSAAVCVRGASPPEPASPHPPLWQAAASCPCRRRGRPWAAAGTLRCANAASPSRTVSALKRAVGPSVPCDALRGQQLSQRAQSTPPCRPWAALSLARRPAPGARKGSPAICRPPDPRPL